MKKITSTLLVCIFLVSCATQPAPTVVAAPTIKINCSDECDIDIPMPGAKAVVARNTNGWDTANNLLGVAREFGGDWVNYKLISKSYDAIGSIVERVGGNSTTNTTTNTTTTSTSTDSHDSSVATTGSHNSDSSGSGNDSSDHSTDSSDHSTDNSDSSNNAVDNTDNSYVDDHSVDDNSIINPTPTPIVPVTPIVPIINNP